MQFLALIVDSFRESFDRKIFWVLLVITLVVVAAMLSIGFEGDRISFCFGLFSARTDYYNPLAIMGRAAIVGAVIYLLFDTILGWIGVMLMIVATASVFPSMIERGAIDVLLSKPISRPRLFLYKYLASMVFALVQATVFVVLTFLVMGLRWGVWVPGYLLGIPLIVLLFSYVFCISAFVAVRTRSTIAAILLSFGAWILFVLPGGALAVFEGVPELNKYPALRRTMEVVSWIPPKTADIPYLAARWAKAGTSIDVFPPGMMQHAGESEHQQIDRAQQLERRQLEKSPLVSIGSSLLFEALVVLCAMWSFSRRDY